MSTFIIASVSADGFIARGSTDSSFSWNSSEDKARFIEMTRKSRVVVMGSNTFATFVRKPGDTPKPLKDRLNIIYSRSRSFEGCETTDKAPTKLISELHTRGYQDIAICGGSQIYSMFLKAGVVDRIFLTIEPIFFGTGVKLFNEEHVSKLTLVSCIQGPSGALLLEYTVNS